MTLLPQTRKLRRGNNPFDTTAKSALLGILILFRMLNNVYEAIQKYQKME